MKHRFFIRSFDIIVSSIIIIIFSIPTIILVIFKLINDGNPLFFNSKRVGKDGNLFTVYKFRTMVDDRKFIQDFLSTIHRGGFEKIPINSEVYTKMGKFFERFQIVEILQLFNVLKGNMSIIGYRPLPLSHVIQLENELGSQMVAYRHSALPGITGISQIVGKTVLSNSERVKVENSYNKFVQSASAGKILLINSLIICETFFEIVFGKHLFLNYIKRQLHISRFPVTPHVESVNYYFTKEEIDSNSIIEANKAI